MKSNESSKETKPVSFRLPIAVFNILQNKGVEMGLSAHEVASKIVQEIIGHEKYQAPIPIECEVVKEPATSGSKKLVLTEVSKQVFHFSFKELQKIYAGLTNGGYHHYINKMPIGAEYNGLTRVSEDLWEVLIETNTLYKSCGQG
jgi:hypothetical protein